MEHIIETEQDLQKLIGQYESIRLEFKASALLAQPPDRIIKQLAEEVSAFANTEGGTIVIGIKESKSGKKSVAFEVDEGTDPAQMLPERLEQLVASNISPPVPGLVVRPIPLSGQQAGQVAFVITVPKGSTAYQARHSLLYYGRNEFAAIPLHDNVIRLLMLRGKVAHAVIELGPVSCLTAEADYQQRQAQLKAHSQRPSNDDDLVVVPEKKRIALEAPERDYDEYSCDIVIRNDGPISIRDGLLSLAVKAPSSLKLACGDKSESWHFRSADNLERCRFRFAPTTKTKYVAPSGRDSEVSRPILFPEQSISYRDARFTAHAPKGIKTEAILEWTLYLDGAPACSGSIDLGSTFRKAREGQGHGPR